MLQPVAAAECNDKIADKLLAEFENNAGFKVSCGFVWTSIITLATFLTPNVSRWAFMWTTRPSASMQCLRPSNQRPKAVDAMG